MAELIKYNLSGTPKKIQQNITADSKQYIRDYMRLYIKNQEKIQCDCGTMIKPYHKYRHVKTKLHLNILERVKQLSI